MLSTPPPLSHRPRPPKPVPPAPLTLVAAELVPDGDAAYVRLSFDRPVSIAGLDAAQVEVAEGPPNGTLWQGVGPGTLLAPGVVRIDLQAYDPFGGTGVTLAATGETGIVAAGGEGGGAAWQGATGVALPYP